MANSISDSKEQNPGVLLGKKDNVGMTLKNTKP